MIVLQQPPAAVSPSWTQTPSAAEIALARSKYSSTDMVDTTLKMTCYVQADGGLAECKGDPALVTLKDRYRLDRDRFTDPTVVVAAPVRKIYDQRVTITQRPSDKDLQALGGSGVAAIQCRIDETGAAQDCDFFPQDQLDDATRAAARRGAALYRFEPATLNGAPVPSHMTLQMHFGGGGGWTPPDWVKRPTPEEIGSAWPAAALDAKISGSAAIRCKVRLSGVLSDCVVAREQPAGFGFGEAALQLAPVMQMKPAAKNGVPQDGATVTVPVNFSYEAADQFHLHEATRSPPPPPAPKSRGPLDDSLVAALAWAPFSAAPDFAAWAGAYPAAQRAAGQEGRAVFRCGVEQTGELKNCDAPVKTSGAFEAAARKLLPRFRVDMAALPESSRTRTGAAALRAQVTVSFNARALAAGPLYIHQPNWTRQLRADTVIAAYPSKAVEAGVMNGSATVECQIAPDGALAACAMGAETPAGLGFGEAAAALAGLMKVNLWTQDGEPTVGGRVRLPLRFIYSRAAPAASAEPASPAR